VSVLEPSSGVMADILSRNDTGLVLYWDGKTGRIQDENDALWSTTGDCWLRSGVVSSPG